MTGTETNKEHGQRLQTSPWQGQKQIKIKEMDKDWDKDRGKAVTNPQTIGVLVVGNILPAWPTGGVREKVGNRGAAHLKKREWQETNLKTLEIICICYTF